MNREWMDDEWVEQFYEMLEHGFGNYTRPVDYKERARRILEGNRKPVSTTREGRTGWGQDGN